MAAYHLQVNVHIEPVYRINNDAVAKYVDQHKISSFNGASRTVKYTGLEAWPYQVFASRDHPPALQIFH